MTTEFSPDGRGIFSVALSLYAPDNVLLKLRNDEEASQKKAIQTKIVQVIFDACATHGPSVEIRHVMQY